MNARWAFALLTAAICVAQSACEDAALAELFRHSEDASSTTHQRAAVPESAIPYYVSFKHNGAHFCAGTLISWSWVLTSASCMDPDVYGHPLSEVTADAGISELAPTRLSSTGRRLLSDAVDDALQSCVPQRNLKINRVEKHPGYSNGAAGRPPYDAKYDVALVNLTEGVNLRWALLPLEVPDCCDGDLLNVGFGRAAPEGQLVERLEMAAFPLVPYPDCAGAFAWSEDETLGKGKANLTAEASICVASGGFCQLDRGSALTLYNGRENAAEVIAIANRATQDCSGGAPYVFSNISFHVPWIFDVPGLLKDIAAGAGGPTCGVLRASQRITETHPAEKDSFPYAVSIRPKGQLLKCQGALISPNHVITAASCVSHDGVALVAHVGGLERDPDPPEQGEMIDVKSVRRHPTFREEGEGVDLAIVELERKASNKPIKLPKQSKPCCENGISLVIYSWGGAVAGGPFPTQLMTGRMLTVSAEECIERGFEDFSSGYICAKGEKEGSAPCRKDSGTPLILDAGAKPILVGILPDLGDNRCGEEKPMPFIKIADVIDWIMETIIASA